MLYSFTLLSCHLLLQLLWCHMIVDTSSPPLPNVAHGLQKPQSSLFALTCQISSFKGLGKKFTSRQTEMLRATVLPLSLHPSFLTIPHLFLILEMSLAE